MKTLHAGVAAFAFLSAFIAAGAPASVPVAPDPATHLVFIIDTSGSMRNPLSNQVYPVVAETIAGTLAASPAARQVSIYDADGRVIVALSPRAGIDLLAVTRAIAGHATSSGSNPVPGIVRALREAMGTDPGVRGTICIIGDEFTGETIDPVLRRLEELNPRQPDGNRRVRINAVQVQTIAGPGTAQPETLAKFAQLMTALTASHGGSLKVLPLDATPVRTINP